MKMPRIDKVGLFPLPTVKVKNPLAPGEYLTINLDDFDSEIHELYQEPAKVVASAESPETPESAAVEGTAKDKSVAGKRIPLKGGVK